MKKLLLWGFIAIVNMVVVVYVLVFTQFGNSLMTPMLETKLSQNVGKEVKINHFSLRPSSLDVGLTIDKSSLFYLKGGFNLFTQAFDMEFKTALNNITLEPITIGSPMTLEGKAKGDSKTFALVAKGNALRGFIDMDVKGTPEALHVSKVTLKGIDVKELLALLGKPAYAQGLVDVTMDIKELTQTNALGEALLNINALRVDEALVAKDFKVDLPKALSLKGTLHSSLQGKSILSRLDLLSSLAAIKTDKTTYDLATQALHSDFRIHALDFSALEPVVKMPLFGKASFDGIVNYSPKGYDVVVNSDIFEGKTTIKIVNDSLEADANALKVDRILALIGQKAYAKGEVHVQAKLKSLQNLSGAMTHRISNGSVNTALVNQDFNQTLPATLNYTLEGDTSLEKDRTKTNATLNSSLAKLSLKELTYDMKASALNAPYSLDVPDLMALKTIAKRTLKGKVRVDGVVKSAPEKLYVDGASEIFGGHLNFSLDNDLFKASLKKAQLPSVMAMLDYPDMFLTELMGDVVYDLKKQTGTIKATSDEGRFKPNQLATLLYALTGFDITKEVYKNIVAQSDITPEFIRFGADLQSQYTTIALKEGSLNQKTNALLGKIAIILKGTTYNATLGGTSDSPKVKLDTAGVLKGVLNQRTEGATETVKEPVKNLLKGFGL